MRIDKHTDLDALIESALCGEPVRHAPDNLAERVGERLRVQALIDRERSRFRNSMAMLAVAVAAILVCGGVFVAFTHLRSVVTYGAPGAKGRFDYLATYFMDTFTSYTGAYSLVVSMMLAAGVLAIVFIPWRGRMRHH
jgi:hypothetical protein